MLRNMGRPLAAAAIMCGAVVGVYALLGRIFTLESTIGKLALVGGPVAVGVVVYVLAVVVLKAITREDCMLLPKGDKIAKLLKL